MVHFAETACQWASVGGPARAVETVWVLPGRHVRGLKSEPNFAALLVQFSNFLFDITGMIT